MSISSFLKLQVLLAEMGAFTVGTANIVALQNLLGAALLESAKLVEEAKAASAVVSVVLPVALAAQPIASTVVIEETPKYSVESLLVAIRGLHKEVDDQKKRVISLQKNQNLSCQPNRVQEACEEARESQEATEIAAKATKNAKRLLAYERLNKTMSNLKATAPNEYRQRRSNKREYVLFNLVLNQNTGNSSKLVLFLLTMFLNKSVKWLLLPM